MSRLSFDKLHSVSFSDKWFRQRQKNHLRKLKTKRKRTTRSVAPRFAKSLPRHSGVFLSVELFMFLTCVVTLRSTNEQSTWYTGSFLTEQFDETTLFRARNLSQRAYAGRINHRC